MDLVLILLGILGVIIFFISLIISAIRKRKLKKNLLGVLVSFVVVIVGVVMAVNSVDTSQVASMTPDMYKQIKKGMSYDEVKEIAGGKAGSETELDESSMHYSFDGAEGVSSDSSVFLTFTDDKLTEKSELGLITKREKQTPEEEAATEAQVNQYAVEGAIEDIIYNVFGKKNTFNEEDSIQNIEYNQDTSSLSIKVYGKDAFTTNTVREGMWMDIAEASEKIKEEVSGSTVTFEIIFPMKDEYGKKSDDVVMRASLSPETLNKIDFKNFDYQNIPRVSDNYYEHPSLKK